MGDTPGTGRQAASRRYSLHALWLIWVIWLPYFVYPLSKLFAAHQPAPRLLIVLVAAALFVGVYLYTTWRFTAHGAMRSPVGSMSGPGWQALALLFGLSIALSLGGGKEWLELFIYTCAAAGVCLPLRRAAAAVVVIVLVEAAVGFVLHDSTAGIMQELFIELVTGFSVISVVRLVGMNRELRMAREEIARLAVSEERLRFARDLHDLLGHSLSLIALKSELAGRLATAAPEKAAAEIRDVEAVARTALQEVRTAVAGYRQPTLASAIRGARELLAAAGISLTCMGEHLVLPAAVEAVLSWTIREGVTNVIRHSRARCCTVRVTRDERLAGVEVSDDGRGSDLAGQSGSGIAGLAERVQRIGGRFEAGPLPGGGFRISVCVSLENHGNALQGPIGHPVRAGEAVKST